MSPPRCSAPSPDAYRTDSNTTSSVVRPDCSSCNATRSHSTLHRRTGFRRLAATDRYSSSSLPKSWLKSSRKDGVTMVPPGVASIGLRCGNADGVAFPAPPGLPVRR